LSATHIAIIGAGIAGLSAAIALRRVGVATTIFEARDTLNTEGAGIVVQPRGLRSLTALGVDVAALGARIASVIATDSRGRTLMQSSYAALAPEAFALGLQRAALLRALHAADAALSSSIRYGHAVTAFDAMRGTLTFANETISDAFDGIVVADGAHSRLRGLLPSLVLRDTLEASSALVALIDADALPHQKALTQIFHGSRHVSMWPVGAREPNEPSKLALALNVFAQDDWQDHPARWWRAQIAALSPALRDALAREPALTPYHYRYRDVSMRSYAHERVVFIGDAAHAMSPQLGLGVSLGLSDALALVDAMAHETSVAGAFVRFSEREWPAHQELQQLSRRVTPLFQSPSTPLAQLRDVGFRLLSSTLMNERMLLQHAL
jgi:2-polyprenyl-6-methoxyphenol hydroxylase-like FAD-dependent oxidoreductase